MIRTDHKLLKNLLESPMQNKKIQLWALSMSGYNCTIENIAGTTNTCADLLSIHPDNVKNTSDDQSCEEVENLTALDVKKIQLWALSMSDYNCTIEYIAGTTNTCADLLSRHPDNVKKISDDQSCEEVEDQTALDVKKSNFGL